MKLGIAFFIFVFSISLTAKAESYLCAGDLDAYGQPGDEEWHFISRTGDDQFVASNKFGSHDLKLVHSDDRSRVFIRVSNYDGVMPPSVISYFIDTKKWEFAMSFFTVHGSKKNSDPRPLWGECTFIP